MSKGLLKADHDPRAAALLALSEVLQRGVDSQAALDAVLSSPRMVPVDKRLCTELVYGVLRRYSRLEFFCLRFLHKPDKLPDEMRLALLCALYEGAFLRTPKRAVVHRTVEHLHHRFGQGLAGVANAVLRNMFHSLNDFHNPPAAFFPTAEEHAAFLLSAPKWLVRFWNEAYGREAARMYLKASAGAPPAGLRLNRSRPDWEGTRALFLEGDPAPLAVGSCSLAFTGPLPPTTREILRTGAAARQSAAALEAIETVLPDPVPAPIWDCCAGRGGKTMALLERGIAVALASDPSASRLHGLADDHAFLAPAAPLPHLVQGPAQEVFPDRAAPLAADTRFGLILADVPCSGLGTLARRPEIRLRRTPEDFPNLLRKQREILDAAAARLAPSGRLLYLTCTLNPAENQGQVVDFLSRHPKAHLESEFATPPDSPLAEFFYAARIRMS